MSADQRDREIEALRDAGGLVQDFLSSGLSTQEAERLWLMPDGLRIFQALTVPGCDPGLH